MTQKQNEGNGTTIIQFFDIKNNQSHQKNKLVAVYSLKCYKAPQKDYIEVIRIGKSFYMQV